MTKYLSKPGKWEAWNEILFLDGSSSRLILGQLPSDDTWPVKDGEGNWVTGTFGDFLDMEHIVAVLSVVEDFEWKVANVDDILAAKNVSVKRLPQVDFGGMEPNALHEGVSFLEEVFRSYPQGKVYVHCKAGRGRSAAMVVAYLATPHLDLQPEGPLTLPEALTTVRRSRRHIKVGGSKVNDLHAYYATQVLGVKDPVWPKTTDLVAIYQAAVDCLWAAMPKLQEQGEVAASSQPRPCRGILATYGKELARATDKNGTVALPN